MIEVTVKNSPITTDEFLTVSLYQMNLFLDTTGETTSKL